MNVHKFEVGTVALTILLLLALNALSVGTNKVDLE